MHPLPLSLAFSALALSLAVQTAPHAAAQEDTTTTPPLIAIGLAPRTGLATDRSHLLVKYRSTSVQTGLGRMPATSLGGRWIAVNANGHIAEVRRELKTDPDVAAVAIDRVRQVFSGDPLYAAHQQYLRGTMDFPQAWHRSNGSGVTVAVIDTGVDVSHPDLGNVLRGHDFVDDDSHPQDPNGHGTFVAGVIAATRGNDRGTAGASRATILPVRALDASGAGTDSTIVRAIRWATTHGADVINLSLGGFRTSRVLADALRFAERNNVLVVAASGNSGGTRKTYPAATPTVVAVGAVDNDDNLTWFSQRGDWVDLVAPGWEIASTFPANRYAIGSGTSFSAPLVSAAAALLIDKHPRWSPSRVRAALLRATADVGSVGPDDYTGFGVPDADGALGGPLSMSGRTNFGGSAVMPSAARTLHRVDRSSIAPEGGSLWYRYSPDSPAHVEFGARSNTASRGVRRLDLVLEVYDSQLNLIRRVDSQKGGGIERIQTRVSDAAYIRVYNESPTRSPGVVVVTARTTGSATSATIGIGPRPTILGASPRPNADEQSASKNLMIEVGRPLSENSANNRHVVLINGDTGQSVSRHVQYDAATDTVTINPSHHLSAHQDYAVELRGLRTPSGAHLPDARYGFATA